MQKKRGLTLTIALIFILLSGLALWYYPRSTGMVKISLPLERDEEIAITLITEDGEEIPGDFTQYNNGTLVLNIPVEQWGAVTDIRIEGEGYLIEAIPLKEGRAAVGNFIIAEGFDDLSALRQEIDIYAGRDILVRKYVLATLIVWAVFSVYAALYYDELRTFFARLIAKASQNLITILLFPVFVGLFTAVGVAGAYILKKSGLSLPILWQELIFAFISLGLWSYLVFLGTAPYTGGTLDTMPGTDAGAGPYTEAAQRINQAKRPTLIRRLTSPGWIVGTLLGAAGIFVIYASLTTFYTADEMGAVMEQLRPRDFLRHWYNNSSHLNYVIMGTAWKYADPELWALKLGETRYQFPKLVHTFLGLLPIMMAVHIACTRLLSFEKRDCRDAEGLKGLSHGIALFLMLILPSITVTLKTYTYDTFSAMPGILSAVLLIVAYKRRLKSAAVSAVLVSAPAVFEKITVVPVFLVSAGVLTYIYLAEAAERRESIGLLRVVAGAALPVLYLAGVCQFDQLYYFGIIRENYSPIADPLHAMGRIVNAFPPLAGPAKLLFAAGAPRFAAILITWILAVLAGGALILLFERLAERLISKRALILSGLAAVLAVYCAVGVIALFMHLQTQQEGVRELLFFIANFVRHLPSALMAMTVFFIIRHRSYEGDLFDVIAMVAAGPMMLPIYIYKSRWNILWFKYMNIFIGMYALMLIVVVLPMLARHIEVLMKKWSPEVALEAYEDNEDNDDNDDNEGNPAEAPLRPRARRGCGLALSLAAVIIASLQLAEIWGSMPAFTTFAPFWYNITALNLPDDERELVCWAGDNTAVIGEKIVELTRAEGINDSDVTIYPSYDKGWWLTCPEGVSVAPMGWGDEKEEYCSYTKTDFYEINPHAIAHEEMGVWGWPPADVAPVIETYYRGYLTSRVYRGCDIKEFMESQRGGQ